MRQKGYVDQEIQETIEALKNKNYLNENNYKRMVFKKWFLKGESAHKIQIRIEQEGLKISQEEIKDWSSEFQTSETPSIIKLIEKKLRMKEIPTEYEEKQKLKNKVSRFLLSKGYDFESINRAIKNYIN